MLDALEKASVIAVDTEANGLFAYQERVTLIQISTLDHDYIVDPLADVPIEQLATVLSNPRVEKVFHAAEYDLIGLRRDFGFHVCPLFDTMHSARLLGKPRVGLAALLDTYFEVRVDKRYQRADWGQRPLPAELLAYARLDTHFLIPLRDRLKQELQARQLWDIAQEDFARLSEVRVPRQTSSMEGMWRLPGVHTLPPPALAVLAALYRWREEEAQRRDVPPFKVMRNEELVALARAMPRSPAELHRVVRTRALLQPDVARQLVALVREARRHTPPSPPRLPAPPSADYRRRLERLRAWRRRVAQHLGVASDVILPREAMLTIARANPASLGDLQALGVLGPARLRRYGKDLLAALHGLEPTSPPHS